MPGLSIDRATSWVLVVVHVSRGTVAPVDLEYWQSTDIPVICGAVFGAVVVVVLVVRREVVGVLVALDVRVVAEVRAVEMVDLVSDVALDAVLVDAVLVEAVLVDAVLVVPVGMDAVLVVVVLVVPVGMDAVLVVAGPGVVDGAAVDRGLVPVEPAGDLMVAGLDFSVGATTVGPITSGTPAPVVGDPGAVDDEMACGETEIAGSGPRIACGLTDGRPIATKAPIRSRTATAAATATAGPRRPERRRSDPEPVEPGPEGCEPEPPNTLVPPMFELFGGQPSFHGSDGGTTIDPERAS
jgi:hypothetical protein